LFRTRISSTGLKRKMDYVHDGKTDKPKPASQIEKPGQSQTIILLAENKIKTLFNVKEKLSENDSPKKTKNDQKGTVSSNILFPKQKRKILDYGKTFWAGAQKNRVLLKTEPKLQRLKHPSP